MFDSEQDVSKYGEQDVILQEYGDIVKELEQELEICKTEQNNIRSELETLRTENKDSADAMHDYISRIHREECGNEDIDNKIIMNLKERITILEMEKDSAIQLWQLSMKTVDTLEQELRVHLVDKKDATFYEGQLKDIKQSYSQAIKALESKLIQTRENFIKQQSLWMNNKETVESLNREKQEMIKRLEDFQRDAQRKDRDNQQTIQSLTNELSVVKAEMQRTNHLKSELEKKLGESRRISSNIMAKNEETKNKMAEALDLIEFAVKEKDIVLQREAQVVEQKTRLEIQLASITEKHAIKMQEDITKLKDTHERNIKKYLLEIKGLKSELREKITLLDRSQRESRLAEEELERIRIQNQDFEVLLQKSVAKNQNFEQVLKHADSSCEINEAYKKQHYLEIQQLEEKIVKLEEKLIASNEKLKQIQQHNSTEMIDCIKLADERTKDAIDRYVNLESQLIKATADDKQLLTTNFKSLQSAFDREMRKRDYERHALENRIHELEVNHQKAMENKSGTNISPIEISSQHPVDIINKHTLDVHVENMDHNWQSLLSEQLNKQQENFEKKIKDITQHITVYQKLSRRWREEAKSLTTRFQAKTKELRGKIRSLQKENAELHKTILIYQQQYRTDGIYSYMQRSENR